MMKLRIIKNAFALALCILSCGAFDARAQGGEPSAEAPLTNAAVIKLVRAGFREKTVIAIINARPTRFNLAPDRLIELKKGGVSERLILAMLARENSGVAESSGEGWEDDDPFFSGRPGASTNKPGEQNDPNETGIFGSSSGSRGSTRSRGSAGANDGDTQSNGSATVRILRPSAEASGATPKLERTPPLDNDAVVELVEAGFTEGTIIRRIEQSPADFDLSPAKLAELRRRRVGEPVIDAMRTAMSGEEEPTKSQD